MIGKTLAHYEITAPLGKGGMGEVFRARDTKLDREVAIKLLPSELQGDPERVARFAREARTLASLHHPNIASLFGLESDGTHRFLVMELVEGEDLSHALRAGPLDLDEVLDVARQLAEGLEDAHEKGIVHRDLKPANVMRTPDGRVKILDFGLARAVLGEGVDESDAAHSPTITAALTQAGTVLGTAAYMSPEQARGRPVDRRADLWSFGVIVWEMLTGRRLFEGETISDTLAAVLRADLPWDDLPDDTPPALRRLLERCLERDPRRRLRDIGEARVRLERWRDDPTTLHASESVPIQVDDDRPKWIPWAVAAVAVLVAAASWLVRPQAPAPESLGLEIAMELDGLDPMIANNGPSILISPDAQWIAYFGSGNVQLFDLDRGTTRTVPGSEFATCMDFSPDSGWIAFQRGGTLWRAPVDGGAPIEVCTVLDPRGITWVDDTTIVFTRSFESALSKVDLRTGAVTALTTLDSVARERSHRWPSRLPDQRHVVYMAQTEGTSYVDATIRVVDTVSGEDREILRGGAFPRYAASGHLTFVRHRTLIAVPFDPETFEVSGLATPVLENLGTLVEDQETDDGSAEIAWSDDGTLVYRTDVSADQVVRPSWLDLETGDLTEIASPGEYVAPKVSPDGRTLAISRVEGAEARILMFDVETGSSRTFGRGGAREYPAGFDTTGTVLTWNRWDDGQFSVLRQPLDGSAAPETLATSDQGIAVNVISRDGTLGLLIDYGPGGAWDMYRIELNTPGYPLTPHATGQLVQVGYDISPDGRWIVHGQSVSATESEAFLSAADDPSRNWRIHRSGDGPSHVMWHPSGDRLILRDRMSRTIQEIPIEFRSGVPQLGNARVLQPDPFGYVREFFTATLAPGGDRMLVLVPESGDPEATDRGRTMLVTHWFDRLRGLAE